MINYKDYYYKYKALKYYLKNNNIEKKYKGGNDRNMIMPENYEQNINEPITINTISKNIVELFFDATNEMQENKDEMIKEMEVIVVKLFNILVELQKILAMEDFLNYIYTTTNEFIQFTKINNNNNDNKKVDNIINLFIKYINLGDKELQAEISKLLDILLTNVNSVTEFNIYVNYLELKLYYQKLNTLNKESNKFKDENQRFRKSILQDLNNLNYNLQYNSSSIIELEKKINKLNDQVESLEYKIKNKNNFGETCNLVSGKCKKIINDLKGNINQLKKKCNKKNSQIRPDFDDINNIN